MLEPSDVISTSVSLLCCGYDVQIACPGFIGFQVWLPLTASLATEPLSRGCEWATHAFKRIASQLSSIYPNNTTVETLAIDMQLPIRLSLPNLLRETTTDSQGCRDCRSYSALVIAVPNDLLQVGADAFQRQELSSA